MSFPIHGEWLLPTALVLMAVSGCSPRSGEAATGRVSGLTGDEVARARSLYENAACGVCHGDSGEGVEQSAPALGGLEPYWTAERLMEYVRDPAAFRAANPDFGARSDVTYELEMPAFDYLSEDELRLLARWLLGGGLS